MSCALELPLISYLGMEIVSYLSRIVVAVSNEHSPSYNEMSLTLFTNRVMNMTEHWKMIVQTKTQRMTMPAPTIMMAATTVSTILSRSL